MILTFDQSVLIIDDEDLKFYVNIVEMNTVSDEILAFGELVVEGKVREIMGTFKNENLYFTTKLKSGNRLLQQSLSSTCRFPGNVFSCIDQG